MEEILGCEGDFLSFLVSKALIISVLLKWSSLLTFCLTKGFGCLEDPFFGLDLEEVLGCGGDFLVVLLIEAQFSVLFTCSSLLTFCLPK